MSNLKFNYLTNDPLVNMVISRMAQRSDEGMSKYGVTMERKDIDTVAWLRNAQEEALDLAIYLERVITDLTSPAESSTPARAKETENVKEVTDYGYRGKLYRGAVIYDNFGYPYEFIQTVNEGGAQGLQKSAPSK